MANNFIYSSFLNTIPKLLIKFQEVLELHFVSKNFPKEKTECLRQAKQLYENIINSKIDSYDCYQSILIWCENNSKDEFNIIRSEYLKYTQEIFPKYHICSNQRQELLLQELNNQQKEKSILHNFEIETIKEEIEFYESYRNNLAAQSKTIIDSTFSPKLAWKDYQNAAHQLVSEVNKIQTLKWSTSVQLTSPKVPVIDVIERNKQATLNTLDFHIRQYQQSLKKESYIAKFIYFFSPARRARKSLLLEYDSKIRLIPDVSLRYEAVEAWHQKILVNNKIKSTDRIYKDCLLPFQSENEQNYFDATYQILKKNKQIVNEFVVNTCHANRTHLGKTQKLLKQLTMLKQNCSELLVGLNNVKKEVAKLEDSGFGYFYNNAHNIVDSVDNLRLIHEKRMKQNKIDLANKIIHILTSLPRHVSLEKITQLNLKIKFEEIKEDNQARPIVIKYLDQLIKDVIDYGGDVTNLNYLGTKQIEFIIKEIGTQEQKQLFENKRAGIIARGKDRKKCLIIKSADSCANYLKENIESGKLREILLSWQKVLKISPNSIDRESKENRSLYRQAMEAKNDAVRFHKVGAKSLEEVVNKVISATYRASFLNKKSSSSMNQYEELGVENTDTLVQIFASKKQSKRWKEKVLPVIMKSPNYDPSSKESSTVDTPRSSFAFKV